MQRRNRKPTTFGTCQICGKSIALAIRAEPVSIQKHGFSVQRGSRDKLACWGSDQPPLEESREYADSLVRFYRQQLRELRQRNHDVAAAVAPPRGISGVSALRARFDSPDTEVAQPRTADPVLVGQIADIERRLALTENVLISGAAGARARRRGTAVRVNMLWRRRNGHVYIVESEEPSGPGRRTTYWCRNVATGVRERVTRNELTRALNEQGLPPRLPDAADTQPETVAA
jgi:hypothetical protein